MPTNGNDSSSLNLKLPALPALTAMTTSATLPEVLASMAPEQPAASVGAPQPAPPPEYFAPTPTLPLSRTNAQVPTNMRPGAFPPSLYPSTPPGTIFSTSTGQMPTDQTPAAPSTQSPLGQIIPSASSGAPETPGWNPQRTLAPAAPTNPLLIPQPNLSPEQALAQQQPPAGATTPFGQMTPPRPRTFGQKLLSTLGQIGGYALSAADPGLAAMIPSTPIGKIAQQQRGLEMQRTIADIAQKQAETGYQKAQTAALPSEIALRTAQANQAQQTAAELASGEWKVSEYGMMVNSRTGEVKPLEGITPENRQAMFDKLLPENSRPYRGDIAQANARFANQFQSLPANVRGKAQLSDYQLPLQGATDGAFKNIDAGLTQLQASAQAAASLAQAGALREQGLSFQRDEALQRSYDRSNTELGKISTPLDTRAAELSQMTTNISLGTPIADSALAPEFLRIVAGSQTGQLRMNEAELKRMGIAGTQWTLLQQAANKWSTDPNHPAIPEAMRNQMRQVIAAAGAKLQTQQQFVRQAEHDLIYATDATQHREIVANAHDVVEAINMGNYRTRSASGKPQVFSIDGGKTWRPMPGQ